jgi:hypothetical protein
VFETTVLFGALTAFLLVFLLSGLPAWSRPVFEVEGIESASVDHFWLAITQPGAIGDDVRARMKALGALAVRTVGSVT